MSRKFLSAAASVLLVVLLGGCWSSDEVNTLAISVCIGIDKSEEGFMVTEQVINPKAIASQKPTHEAPVFLFTEEGKDVGEAVARMSRLSSREICSSHLRMVILDEDVAREGVGPIMDYLMRFAEYRTDFYFAIAKGASARDILGVLTPIEVIPGMEMFNKQRLAEQKWAPVKATRIIELANAILSDGVNPVIPGIEVVDGNRDEKGSMDVLMKSDGTARLEYTSMGVFKRDKLVGWMSEEEARGCNYITGNVKRTVFDAELDGGVRLTFEVTKAKSDIRATAEGGKPKVDVSVRVEYMLVGVAGDFDVSSVENREVLNRAAEEKVKKACRQAVEKAQKELKSDVFGFGEAVRRRDPSYWKTVRNNWDEVFVGVPVDIEVSAKLVSTGTINKPLYMKEG